MKKNKVPPPRKDPNWVEEWVSLSDIIKHERWQVRMKLNPAAVKRYAEMTRAGSLPPPIKLGRVKGKLFLLDGWHRMASGALQVVAGLEQKEVLAQVAILTAAEARWEAANANMAHGESLKPRDLHAVFKAFVGAKRHVNPNGTLLSYREIAPYIGKPHTTVRTWMIRYFPKVAKQMGGEGHGNVTAESPPTVDMAEEHREMAIEGLLSITQRLELLTPEARWDIAGRLEAAREQALKLGVKEPELEEF